MKVCSLSGFQRRWAAGISLALSLQVVCPERAQAAPTAGEVAVARRLFTEATELQEQRRWNEAAEKLREAIKIKETPGLRYHLAFCEEQQGLLVEAQVDYDRAGELIRSGVRAPDVEVLLEEARAKLVQRVPSLTVELSTAAEIQRFSVDDRDLVTSLLGKPIPLNPGQHRLLVQAAGYEDSVQTIDLAVGAQERLTLNLKPSLRTTSPPPDVGVGADAGVGGGGWGAREYVLLGEGIVTAGALGFGIFSTIQRGVASTDVDLAEGEILIASESPVGSTGACSVPEGEQLSAELQRACARLSASSDDVDRWTALMLVGYGGAVVGGVTMLITALAWDDSPSDSGFASVRPTASWLPGQGSWYGVSARF